MSNEMKLHSVVDLLNSIADNGLKLDMFAPRLAELLSNEGHDNWQVVSNASSVELSGLDIWASARGFEETTDSGMSNLTAALQNASDAIYGSYGESRPIWSVRRQGDDMLVLQQMKNIPIVACVVRKVTPAALVPTTVDSYGKRFTVLRNRIVRAFNLDASRTDVRESLVHCINEITDMRWKLVELPLNSDAMRPVQFAGCFPTDVMLGRLADTVKEALHGFYPPEVVVVPTMHSGLIGTARCMTVKLTSTLNGDTVYEIKALMSLDDVDKFDEVYNTVGLTDQSILETIPDSGDRSRNEPVYLMSAKATRSLLDGADLYRSLDDIRRVAKQQGWSDVQAHGQQLLFIS